MLTISYELMRKDNFRHGMMKLANFAGIKSPKAAYNLAKIVGRYFEEQKIADDLYNKIIHEFAKKDEKGDLEPFDGKAGTFFVLEENQKAWTEKVTEYAGITFQVDRPKMQLEDVIAAGLTPIEINALEPLLALDESPAEVEPIKAVRGV